MHSVAIAFLNSHSASLSSARLVIQNVEIDAEHSHVVAPVRSARFQPTSEWDARRILQSLKTDLQRTHAEHELRPDLICFTSDAVFGQVDNDNTKSIAVQFREANDFLGQVRHAFGSELPKRNLFLVPGNHDANRKHITRTDHKGPASVMSWGKFKRSPGSSCRLATVAASSV